MPKTPIIVVNPHDKNPSQTSFVLVFGAYGSTYLLGYGSLDTVLDECVDWIAEHQPGILATKEVHEEFERLQGEGMSEEDAWEISAMDTVCAGNSGDYLNSWELSISLENPTKTELVEFFKFLNS